MDQSEYDGRIDALERSPDVWDDGNLAARSSVACSLAMTSVGDLVQVVSLRGSSQMNRRLIDMGISVNVQGTIVSRAEGGLVVFARDGCRLGIGATMAQQIFVKVLNGSALDRSSASQSSASQSSASQSSASQSSFSKSYRSLIPFMSQTTSANRTTSAPISEQRDAQPLDAKLPSKPLSEMSVGDSGSVVGYEKGNRAYRKKLLAMGLTPGTAFTITHQAPMGDPLELKVRGSKVSLRKGEAAALQVVPDLLSNSSSGNSSSGNSPSGNSPFSNASVNAEPADEMTNLEPTSVLSQQPGEAK